MRPRSLLVLGCLLVAAAPPLRAAQPLPTIRRIAIEGNQSVPTNELLGRLTIKPGQPFNPDGLKLSAGVLESVYRDKGYYEVRVSTAVEPAGKQVDVRFSVNEGALYHVGQISVTGNRIVSRHIIVRTLNVHTGDLFSQSKIFEADRQLYMTGYFQSIDVGYSTTTAHAVDIAIHVKERATRYIKGGFGYGTQTKESLSLGYEDLNFLGNARKLDLSATYSGFLTNPSHYRTTLFQGNLTQPNLFDSPYEGQTNLSREYDDREAYDSYTTATRWSVGRRYSSAITASLRYRYQGTRVTRVSPLAATPGFTNISAAGPTFTFDNTNDPFLPSIGWRVLGTYEEGTRLFAGDVRFHKLEGRAGRFDRPLGEWVFFEGLQAGQILPDSTSDRDIIPIYERYFIGGANTVRGYSERELGPRDATGAPLGGDAFLVGNFELRHPLYKKLWGVTFFDGGQLFPTDPGHRWPHADFRSVNEFRYATGFGLRLNSPVGAVRLEFGYKLNPAGGTGFFDRTAIHFSIGEVF